MSSSAVRYSLLVSEVDDLIRTYDDDGDIGPAVERLADLVQAERVVTCDRCGGTGSLARGPFGCEPACPVCGGAGGLQRPAAGGAL